MKKYYIYHIPNYTNKSKKWVGILGKIGCTDNIQKRQREYGKKYQLEILETHTDIKVASEREIQLQKEYSYPVDKKPYWMKVEENQRLETRAKISKAHAGKTHSEETKAKMSEAQWKPVLRLSLDGTFEKEYPSVKFVREDGYNSVAICNCLNGRSSTSGKKKWAYK